MRKAILVVDMQNDFIDGSLGTKEAIAIVPKVVKRLEEAKNAGEDIYFTKDTHFDNYLETSEGKKLPVKHCIKGTKGFEICDDLKKFVDANDKNVIEKLTFGCKDIAKYFEKYDEITIVGLCTDICVISNTLILKANFPEKKINAIKELCAGVTVEKHEAAINVMYSCQIDII